MHTDTYLAVAVVVVLPLALGMASGRDRAVGRDGDARQHSSDRLTEAGGENPMSLISSTTTVMKRNSTAIIGTAANLIRAQAERLCQGPPPV